eukprot:COSAG06_NODE_491_length_15081_cov_9.093245_13_plen_486_part_00
MGELKCVPFDCGLTLDGSLAEASAFAPCGGGTGLGDICITTCSAGYYSTVGNGQAEFICTPLENSNRGLWMQQGFSPWWDSSLQCTKCPTIQNCVVASCSTGTDAQCARCDDGYYAFRHDEEPTRCLQVTVTLLAAGFSPQASGLFSFRFAADSRGLAASVPSDLLAPSVLVPSTASLMLDGTGTETIASSISVQGGLRVSNLRLTGGVYANGFSVDFDNVIMSGAWFSALAGSTTMTDVSGTMTFDAIRTGGDSTLRITGGSGLLTVTCQDGFAVDSGSAVTITGPLLLNDTLMISMLADPLYGVGTTTLSAVSTRWTDGNIVALDGTIPGTLTASVDEIAVGTITRMGDASATVTPPEFLLPPVPATFHLPRVCPGCVSRGFNVISGPCTVSNGGGISDYDRGCVGRDAYGNNEYCEIKLSGISKTLSSCPNFSTEQCCDKVTINGVDHSGTDCPIGVHVDSESTITWLSDGSVTSGSWMMCF